jgi:hypothetical protein
VLGVFGGVGLPDYYYLKPGHIFNNIGYWYQIS